ncbi:hypothetical protein CP09DC77_0720B, partial [Chlamydia psittaci 09DC77]
PRPGGGGGG